MTHSSLQPASTSQPTIPSGSQPPGSSFGNGVKNMVSRSMFEREQHLDLRLLPSCESSGKASQYIFQSASYSHEGVIRNWMLLLQRVVIPSLVFPKEHYSDEWRWDRKLFFQTFYTNMTKSINISCETVSIPSRPRAAYYGLAVEAQDTFAKSQSIGAFPVIERFPWLRYMPSWFPGCDFGKVAAQYTVPFEMAMNRSHGIAYLSRNPDLGNRDLIIVELAEQNEGNYTAIETQSEEWEWSCDYIHLYLTALMPIEDDFYCGYHIPEVNARILHEYQRDSDEGKAKDEQGTLDTDIPEEFIGVLPRHSKPYQYSTRRNQDAKEVIMATSLTQPLHSSMVKSQNYCFYQLFYESSDSSVWTYAVLPGLDHLS
ncbi:hypothetical protein DFJ43DRAFT_1042324 [Lentinula guzmanii]|uniref:Uncharacterized protein n=1 Tax=Lentinula guzmanii TaxID=2804957 RepID=A0AA38JGE1_9AGAR|nr:hypothetical protein DFJ43DRAFT_1042324 [Lentinula guzmanii]